MTITPLENPIEALIFDCDGTLTKLEGIDELARMNGVGEVVENLTANAMGHGGLNPKLYHERLNLVKPTQNQVKILGEKYIEHCMPDIPAVIQLLETLNKKIYIVSAGLFPAVAMLGDYLKIPRQNIFAVNIIFDAHHNYLDFDHDSPLVNNNGKRIVISQIKKNHDRIVHVGDGMNDYSAHDLVTRFVGYGGAFYHARVAEACQYYIACPSMSALLPLCLTQSEYEKLNKSSQCLQSLNRIEFRSLAGRIVAKENTD